ncbi:MAG: tetratricopeptide 4 [Gemmatimonadetes bacterium]|jgi:hypothetical protein|nr:tetratricopeptide 4 [Gemmatimonadota bacterium]
MRLRTAVLLASLAPALSGCSMLRATLDGWGEDRYGLSRSQRTLRIALQEGNFPRALAWQEEDAMLRVLTTAVATYYASQYERSASLLDTAALLADARITTSLSRGTMSMVTNDLARPYQPRRTERLFVPYYGMLSWVRLGRWEDAAVEARRMVSLLAQYASARDDGERALHATMHHLAGVVFERAGEREDAAVAYRNAHALVGAFAGAPATRSRDTGEVVIVVERGFVAHRSTETIRIPIGHDDRDSLRASDESRRRVVDRIGARFAGLAAADGAASGTASLRQRLDVQVAHAAPAGSREGWGHRDHGADDDEDLGDLRLAFPVLRRSPRPWAGAPRLVGDGTVPVIDAPVTNVAASVDDASASDERRERASVVTRELARATAKYALAKAVRDRKGKVAGTVADIASTLLERADVRSWHLLPQELVLMRVRLPAGQHGLRVAVGEGASYREVSLGPVTVAAGVPTVVSARLWSEPAPRRRHRDDHCDLVMLRCSE